MKQDSFYESKGSNSWWRESYIKRWRLLFEQVAMIIGGEDEISRSCDWTPQRNLAVVRNLRNLAVVCDLMTGSSEGRYQTLSRNIAHLSLGIISILPLHMCIFHGTMLNWNDYSTFPLRRESKENPNLKTTYPQHPNPNLNLSTTPHFLSRQQQRPSVEVADDIASWPEVIVARHNLAKASMVLQAQIWGCKGHGNLVWRSFWVEREMRAGAMDKRGDK